MSGDPARTVEAARPADPTATPALVRQPELYYPVEVAVGTRTSLLVALCPLPHPQMPTINVQPAAPPIEVVVRAHGFDIEGTNTQMIDLMAGDEGEARFVLTPREPGPQTIRVDLLQNGRRISMLQHTANIVEHLPVTPAPTATVHAGPVVCCSRCDAPDLELLIEIDHHDTQTLHFTLHSTKEHVHHHHVRAGTVQLQGSPLAKVQVVYDELSAMARKPPATPVETAFQRRRLARLGNQLWDELVPEPLQTAYWLFKEQVRTLLITSDEPWIPWELVKPYRFDENDKLVDEPFLCETFIVGRWLSGLGPADHVPMQRIQPVAAASDDLQSVQEELAYLAQLNQIRADVTAHPPFGDRSSVLDLFEAGDFSVLHFAVHGTFDALTPDNSGISLSDGILRPSDVRGRFGDVRKRPLVFINACHGARAEFTFTGLGGWADRLVRQACVGAFVGTLWEVNDRLALVFAEAFYTALLRDNKPIGEAFRLARQAVREAEPTNSTWLAYVLYADPSAHAADDPA